MATQSKIFIQIDDEQIELTGEAKEEFLLDRKKINDDEMARQAEYQAKQDARTSALEKLAETAGLTSDEIAALLS